MRRRRHAAQVRLDARQQLGHLERLGDVVVGAELEADHLVDHLAARRQHDHRRLDAALAQLAADVEAAHARQHQVEEQQIEGVARRALEPALAVRRAVDAVALAGQPIGQRQDDAGFVLDQQDSSSRCVTMAAARRRPTPSWPFGGVAVRAPAAYTVKVLPAPGALFSGDLAAVRLDDPLHQAQARARRPGSAPRRRRARGRTDRRSSPGRRRRCRCRGR